MSNGTSNHLKEILVRFTLPVRDVALSPDGEWIAASSDEVEVKMVKRKDIEQIHVLRDHPKPVKNVTFDPTGTWLACSCTDGKIYLYRLSSSEPRFVRAIDGVIPRLDTTDDAVSKCVWHPLGDVFACPTPSREIAIVNASDGRVLQRTAALHNGPITGISWTPNGRLLASAAFDGNLIVWNTKTMQILQRHNYEKILDLSWHTRGDNLLCWTTSWGEVHIDPKFLQHEDHLELLRASPEAWQTTQLNGQPQVQPKVNGTKPLERRPRAPSIDSLDEYLADAGGDDHAWIEDDDGAGYINGNGKRTNGHALSQDPNKKTRYNAWQPDVHESFQPNSTPWRGNRKYLCLNLIGFVWTVNQSTHNTVTVEFYDRETYRDFHFTDPFQYDKACLTHHGTLFSAPANHSRNQPALLFYRPHETWTNRADFRIELPDGEDIACIALSKRHIIAYTTKNYIRTYTLFGTPVRVSRLKSSPAVTCAAHDNHLITLSNGAVQADGMTQLLYTIENLSTSEVYQSSDLVALGTANTDAEDDDPIILKTLFWTDTGDPAIYDSTGTLLILTSWRIPGQARWTPVLDTRLLDRLRDGKKEETYWPVAIADEKFHCIILKGGESQPYFPRPLLSEFDLEIPIGRRPKASSTDDPEDMDGESTALKNYRLEEQYIRSSILTSLREDLVASQGEHASHADRVELSRREIEMNKLLLQLLAAECREGEDHGMKALEVVRLMKDPAGTMIEAASKIAGRWGRSVLEGKIRELGERRLEGLEE